MKAYAMAALVAAIGLTGCAHDSYVPAPGATHDTSHYSMKYDADTCRANAYYAQSDKVLMFGVVGGMFATDSPSDHPEQIEACMRAKGWVPQPDNKS